MNKTQTPLYVIKGNIGNMIFLALFVISLGCVIINANINTWYLVLLGIFGTGIVLYFLCAHYIQQLEFYSEYILIVRPLFKEIIKVGYSEIERVSTRNVYKEGVLIFLYINSPKGMRETAFPFDHKKDKRVIEILQEHGIECKNE